MRSVDAHRRAEGWMALAEQYTRRNLPRLAQNCWRHAGDCEREALTTIPLDRPRTRQILAESARVCYERAEMTAVPAVDAREE